MGVDSNPMVTPYVRRITELQVELFNAKKENETLRSRDLRPIGSLFSVDDRQRCKWLGTNQDSALSSRVHQLEIQLKKVTEELGIAQTKETVLKNQLEQDRKEYDEKLFKQSEAFQQRNAETSLLSEKNELLRIRLDKAQKRQAEIESAAMDAFKEERAVLDGVAQEQEEVRCELVQRERKLSGEREQLNREREQLKREREAVERKRSEAEIALSTCKETAKEIEKQRSELEAETKRLKKSEHELKQREGELGRKKNELDEREREVNDFKRKLEITQQELEDANYHEVHYLKSRPKKGEEDVSYWKKRYEDSLLVQQTLQDQLKTAQAIQGSLPLTQSKRRDPGKVESDGERSTRSSKAKDIATLKGLMALDEKERLTREKSKGRKKDTADEESIEIPTEMPAEGSRRGRKRQASPDDFSFSPQFDAASAPSPSRKRRNVHAKNSDADAVAGDNRVASPKAESRRGRKIDSAQTGSSKKPPRPRTRAAVEAEGDDEI